MFPMGFRVHIGSLFFGVSLLQLPAKRPRQNGLIHLLRAAQGHGRGFLDDVRLCKQAFDFGDNATWQLNNAKATHNQLFDCGLHCG
jgi:hypothetical protein